VQHNGVLIGIICGIALLIKHQEQYNKNLVALFASSLLAVGFDFKPHIFLPFMIALLVNRNFKILLMCAFQLLVAHLSYSFYFRMPLDLYWVERLTGRSEVTTDSNGGDNSFWVLLNSLVSFSEFWLVCGFIAYLLATILVVNKMKGELIEPKSVQLLMCIPLLLPYVHTYDFLVISLIITVVLMNQNSWALSATFLLLLVPTVSTGTRLMIGISLALLVLWFASEIGSGFTTNRTRLAVLSASTSGYLLTATYLSDSLNLKVSLIFAVILAVGATAVRKIYISAR
jgi:hypothetical protein